jgi:flagellar hook-length control protein FliK
VPFAQTLQQSISAQQQAAAHASQTSSSSSSSGNSSAANTHAASNANGDANAQASGSSSAANGSTNDTSADASQGASPHDGSAGATQSSANGANGTKGTKGSKDDQSAASQSGDANAASAAEQAAAAAAAAAQAQADAAQAANAAQNGAQTSDSASAGDATAGNPALAGVTATGDAKAGTAAGNATPKSMRAALQAAFAAQMGSQTITTGAGASTDTASTHALGGAGSLHNGIGAPPLSAKAFNALAGQGKDAHGAAGTGTAPDTAKAAQSAAAAQDGSAAATAAQAVGAGSDDTQDAAALKGVADAAHAAMVAGQSSQAAQAAQTTQAANIAGGIATSTAAAASLTPPVGTPDWEDALSQKVVFLSNMHQQSAELTLNPPQLGPLQVVLQMADNHAHALFVSPHQQVREAVEAALPKLRDALETGGLSLGSTSVSDGFARQANQQDQRSGNGKGGARQAASAEGIGDGTMAISASVPMRRTVGLVDTFA